MDFPFKHWSAITRRFPSSLPVANTNFLKSRTFRLNRVFQNFSFGFIFKGKGDMIRNGVSHVLEAPCVYTVYPGEKIESGPLSPSDPWDQLYFDYDAKFVGEIERMGLVDPETRIWPIAHPANIWLLMEELCALSQQDSMEGTVDFVDRLCERIVIESKIWTAGNDRHLLGIKRIVNQMSKDPNQPFDLKETARLLGLSQPTFRRRWMEVVGMPPRSYQEHIRIQEACRMLVETNRPIREIARRMGFNDEFYFSRRFRVRMKVSPRAYRQRFSSDIQSEASGG